MRKVGVFLIMVGVFLMALYLLSDVAGSARIGLLLSGGLVLGLGIWIFTRTKPEEKPKNTRFQTLRQMKNRPVKSEEKKKKKKNEKE
jgi:sugar phosphate permease